MTASAYKPGDLSLLFNPSAKPDIFIAPAPAVASTVTPATAVNASLKPVTGQLNAKRLAQQTKQKATAAKANSQTATVASIEPAADDKTVDASTVQHVSLLPVSGKKRKRIDTEAAAAVSPSIEQPGLNAFASAAARRVARKQQDIDAAASDRSNTSKKRKAPSHETDDRLPRTLFVGNVSVNTTQKQIIQLFGDEVAAQNSAIESVRFRSFAPSNPKLSKKASFVTQQLSDKKQTMNAYVVLKQSDRLDLHTIIHACNGRRIDGHIVRVDSAQKKAFDARRAVFVGNLPFDALEDELHSLFAPAGDGASAIESVRIVRDAETNVGKGIAYVLFKSIESVKPALSLNKTQLRDRQLRVMRAMDQDKQALIQSQKAKIVKASKSSLGKNDSSKQAAGKQAAAAARQASENTLRKTIHAPRVKPKHAKRKAMQAAAAAAGGVTAAPTQTSNKSHNSAAKQSYGGRNSVKRAFEGERAKPSDSKKSKFAKRPATNLKKSLVKRPRMRKATKKPTEAAAQS